MFFEVAIDVLDHHDGRIDHHADADRQTAKRHQICRLPRIPHEDECDKHAKGNCRGGNERAAEVPKQQHQDHQNQEFALNQRLNDRVYAVIDEFGLIVEVNDLNARRQCFVNLGDFLFNSIDDLLGILVDAFEDDAGDDFALTILGYCTLTNLVPDLNARHIAYANGCAPARVKHDVLDVIDVFDQPKAAHDILFIAMLDEVGAGVLIVCLNRVEQRFQRDVVINQRLLIDDYLVLLYVAAETQHISDAGHRAQLQLDDPILNRAQLLIALAMADDLIEIYLTGSGGDGTHRRLEPRRNILFRVSEPLKDLLPRKINIGVVAEINGNDREPKFGFRFHPGHA